MFRNRPPLSTALKCHLIQHKFLLYFLALPLLVVLSNCDGMHPRVETGLDRLGAVHQALRGKRVGIITNHTGYNRAGRHIVDLVTALAEVEVVALFGPEHGLRGTAEAGQSIPAESDPLRDLPIYSLYGADRKPTPQMLEGLDALIFDIQDIGTRYYTYVYTMALAMEAAAEYGKEFVVLDRPNPLGGVQVEGNVLDPEYATFVGLFPIPVRHGMTVGELAGMINSEGWLRNGVHADLRVIPMQGWARGRWFDETGLRFVSPSPNMPELSTALVYPGTCLLEGTNVSEGRGTRTPFEVFGAPWVDAERLVDQLQELDLKGVRFEPAWFTPVTIPGAALHPKFEGRLCRGARILVTDRGSFEPYWTGLRVIQTLHRLYADRLQWHPRHFDRLAGTGAIREAIMAKQDLELVRQSWQDQFASFLSTRRKYLLYE